MSMHTHVIGFKAPDAKWKKMKKIYDSCTDAGIDVPEEVLKFFNYEPPDDAGVEVELEESTCIKKWRTDGEDGFVIDVKKLLTEHADVTHVRVYNSY